MKEAIYWMSNSDDVQLLAQVGSGTVADYDDLIALRAARRGGTPFGDEYSPIQLIAYGAKKNKKGDVCITGLSPFIVLSEQARNALHPYLEPAGEFLEVKSPWTGYVGYHVTKEVEDGVNLDASEHVMYENGPMIRNAVLFSNAVAGYPIFTVKWLTTTVYVSESFRLACIASNLRGLRFFEVAVS